jgi:DNA-directed RNA polymerase subunit RPC12/RpoP
MSEFKFSCPKCGQHLQCDEQYAGREIQCPGCNVLMRIPPVPGKTAQYNPESGKTWATYVGSGAPPPPAGLAVRPKENPDAPEQH